MHTKLKLSITLVVIFLSLSACKNKEKYTPIKGTSTTPINESTTKPMSSFKDDLHTVTVKEILKTKRYLYIKVSEKGSPDPFWIATRIMDVKVGETYFYKGGLLKTNFESKEFKRVFDKIYLVSSDLVPANHGSNPMFQNEANTSSKMVEVKTKSNKSETSSPKKNIVVKGSIRISDLIKNAKKYKGKTVQISGVCGKINADIMNRNWIHLKDGSQDSFDLVITSNEFVKEGDTVTIKATVTLNKDFGAGYKYDLILENGTIVH